MRLGGAGTASSWRLVLTIGASKDWRRARCDGALQIVECEESVVLVAEKDVGIIIRRAAHGGLARDAFEKSSSAFPFELKRRMDKCRAWDHFKCSRKRSTESGIRVIQRPGKKFA